MKRNGFISMTLLLAMAFWIPGIPGFSEAAEPAGSVLVAQNPAWIARGGERLPAEVGARLFPGDVLQTGGGGALGVTLRDNTRFSMGPDSELVVNDFVFQPHEGRFSLILKMAKGSFSFLSGLIGKLSPESEIVETPVGTIGIRGTHFFARVEGE